MYSSTGIEELKDNTAPYLEKERILALLKVKVIPNEIIGPYDLTKKIASMLLMLQKATYEINQEMTEMKPGGMIPNRFTIMEDWTKSQKDSWRSFLVFNHVF